MMHFIGEAPLIKDVALVQEPSLIKVLVIKEKDLEQVVPVEVHEKGDQLMGRTSYTALIKRGKHFFKVNWLSWEKYMVEPPAADLKLSKAEAIKWWEEARKLANEIWVDTPQLFVR